MGHSKSVTLLRFSHSYTIVHFYKIFPLRARRSKMSPQDGRISPIHESSSNDSSFFEVLKKRRVAEKPKEIHGVTREDRPAPEPNDADVAKTRNDRISLLTAWWREVVSLAIATAAFIAIIVTMVKYNKKEQPTWKHAINLNTLIAILSTLLRACMVLVIEEGEVLMYDLAYKLANALQSSVSSSGCCFVNQCHCDSLLILTPLRVFHGARCVFSPEQKHCMNTGMTLSI